MYIKYNFLSNYNTTTFYNKSEMLYVTLPNWKLKILKGDLNAKIGKRAIYIPKIREESLHRKMNENGSMLVTFTSNRNMVINSSIIVI